MNNRSIVIAAAAAAAMTSVGGLSTATAVGSPDAVGLSGNGTKLVRFDLDSPQKAGRSRLITGLVQDTAFVGIDYRVQDRELYGVGNQGGIYTVNVRRGSATLVDRPRVTLDGSNAYGVDFNPAANALRIVSAKGANLRVPFATSGAAVVDTPLTRPATQPATGTVPATGVTGAAYTNNDLSVATATTLFVIDTERDQVAIQSPANAGTTAPTGSVGIDTSGDVGFDIGSNVRKGQARTNAAYAVSGGRLYTIDLLTGAKRLVGKIGVKDVTDLAVAIR